MVVNEIRPLEVFILFKATVSIVIIPLHMSESDAGLLQRVQGTKIEEHWDLGARVAAAVILWDVNFNMPMVKLTWTF